MSENWKKIADQADKERIERFKRTVKIRLEDWGHHCGDGCCYTYGTDIYINGDKIEGDGTDTMQAITLVLTHLGYIVENE